MKRRKKFFASPTQITGHFLKKLGEINDTQMERDIEDRC
tara:strand:+ start:501 stop:617 length:117 start_codon:yes stop_codon:yes gene_type:complete